MSLKSAKKYTLNDVTISTRVRTVADTLAQIGPVCKLIGVTRISDITDMDRLQIPNYSAVLPGTEDTIWVYGGKGATKLQAKASALMESIERFCSLSSNYSKDLIQGSYALLSSKYNKVLHPDEVLEPVERSFDDEKSIVDFVPGFDLLNNEDVLVPAQLAFSKYFGRSPSVNPFLYSHTNGLASGNVMEEAICHALCELIERDAASISSLCSSHIPYSIIRNIVDSLRNLDVKLSSVPNLLSEQFVDDASIFPDVDISQIAQETDSIKLLVNQFANCGIPLMIKDITQKNIGIPTFVVSSTEWISSDYGLFAKGYGTHPDSRVALIRAITELSQTRAANIQGARDDFRKVSYRENDEIYKRKWEFIPTYSHLKSNKKNSNTISFSDVRSYVRNDILDEIELILNLLRKGGLRSVIIVDLTIPNVGIPVVRAIVPGLETFEVARLFTNTELLIGRRAKQYFRKVYI